MYFSNDTLGFLEALAHNNDRAWFQEHKEAYETFVRDPALQFITDVGDWFDAENLPYKAVAKNVGGSLGKIHRDVRFSADKTPYNDHVLVHFQHRDATPDHPMPGLGIRFDPEGAGIGGGIWSAPTPVLNRIRDAIVADPDGWSRASSGVRLDGERLKSAPRGYGKNHPLVEALRLKNYLGHVELAAEAVTGNLLKAFQAAVRPVLDYNRFLESALS